MDTKHWLMLGAVIPKNEFAGDLWDDKWLPHIEGHPGVDLLMVREEAKNLYCGKVYGKSLDGWTEEGFEEIDLPSNEDFDKVRDFLKQLGIEREPRLMLVTVWT